LLGPLAHSFGALSATGSKLLEASGDAVALDLVGTPKSDGARVN
jgi:hypothetical protein